MKNLFSIDSQPRPSLPRNVVPLSYQNLFTTEFGRITPVFCKEVLPDDTFQIDGSIAIQGMPTVFPVQTRIRASLSFFYSRNRNVFDEFEDFIFKTKEVEAPWLKLNKNRAKRMISTGSLGDFFNIATTYASDSLISSSSDLISADSPAGDVFDSVSVGNYLRSVVGVSFQLPLYLSQFSVSHLISLIPSSVVSEDNMFLYNENAFGHTGSDPALLVVSLDEDNGYSKILDVFDISFSTISGQHNFYVDFSSSRERLLDYSSYSGLNVSFHFVYSHDIGSSAGFRKLYFSSSSSSILDATDDSVIDFNPYIGDNPQDRLDVWKFRHYEMICNYYYRDDRNNPYYLNGEPQYNEFIPTHAGGPDENIYDFHYAPWEKDPFTTAVQSPQFGDAPLVGITINSDGSSADLVFNKDGGTVVDGASPVESYPRIRVHIDDEGYIDGIGDFSDDVPSASLRKLINGIQSKQGISINDFRVTNSFQRFLENTLRRGLRYRNQLKSHFGVSVDYPDIDVPEYIGGVSTELNVSRVTNTADSPNAGLGDFVGQLSGLLQMKHKITRYIHEHGFIMGLLTLTPIPTYAQITSKDNLKLHPFDFYQTEFGKIGYVPIHYNEISPLQTGVGESIDDVFGYQKAWYDYMFAFDEVHGDFRTTLKDFVLSRTFADRPILVEDFVRVKPDQLNHIFVTQNIADAYGSSAKFLCNAFFSVSAKRPIPVRGIPSLE